MRKKLWIAAGFSLVLAAGLLLPYGASVLQDRREADLTYRYEIQDISFVQMKPWSFDERLQGAGVTMALSEVEQGENMDEAEAEETTREILDTLEQNGVISPAADGWTLEQIKATMITARTGVQIEDAGDLTRYYGWLCRVSDAEGREFSVLLDDETGKLLASLYYGHDPEAPAVTEKMGEKAVALWAEFCEDSYGYTFQGSQCQENAGKSYLSYALFFTNELGEKIELFYLVGPDFVEFQQMVPF